MQTGLSPLIQKNRVLRFALDLLFPVHCVGCKKEGTVLCAACWASIVVKRIPSHVKPVGISAVYAACEYREPLVATIIQALKYGGVTDLAGTSALLIAEHVARTGLAVPENAVVVPVPLSKKRLRERGFNQSELIGRRVARALLLPFLPNVLSRTRDTAPQTAVENKAARAVNIKGAFACYSKEAINGKHVVLIDDVFTTGATLSECAKTLKSAGATGVTALTVAE